MSLTFTLYSIPNVILDLCWVSVTLNFLLIYFIIWGESHAEDCLWWTSLHCVVPRLFFLALTKIINSLRGTEQKITVTYWVGCLSFIFTNELHGSIQRCSKYFWALLILFLFASYSLWWLLRGLKDFLMWNPMIPICPRVGALHLLRRSKPDMIWNCKCRKLVAYNQRKSAFQEVSRFRKEVI